MGVFDSLKQGVGKATFQADKMLRVNRIESQVNTAKKNLDSHTMSLGQAAYQLFKEGKLQDQALLEICDQMLLIEKEMQEKEAEADAVRAEVPPQDRPVAPLFGHVCEKCRINLPVEAAFCNQCGGPASEIPGEQTTEHSCPSCGVAVDSEAKLCPACGTRMDLQVAAQASEAASVPEIAGPASALSQTTEVPIASVGEASATIESPPASEATPNFAAQEAPLEQAITPQSAPGNPCPTCGFEVQPEVRFCTQCGGRMTLESPTQPLTTDTDVTVTADFIAEAKPDAIPPAQEIWMDSASALAAEVTDVDVPATESLTCAACGVEVPVTAELCPECGSDVTVAASVEASSNEPLVMAISPNEAETEVESIAEAVLAEPQPLEIAADQTSQIAAADSVVDATPTEPQTIEIERDEATQDSRADSAVEPATAATNGESASVASPTEPTPVAEPSSRFCTNCGTRLPATFAFCNQCGQALSK